MRCLIIFLFISILAIAQTLRCSTDDGPSEEDIKKIIRTCMKTFNDNSGSNRRNDTDNNHNDYDDDGMGDGNDDNTDLDRNNNGNYGNQRFDNRRTNNWNDRVRKDDTATVIGTYNRNDNNDNYGQSNHQDGNCIQHCFFKELKMTNNENYPDKHRMIQVMTKDIRDRELKEFHMDSIQECFHLLELENDNRSMSKCEFSQNILHCLTDRARANCSDFHNQTMIF